MQHRRGAKAPDPAGVDLRALSPADAIRVLNPSRAVAHRPLNLTRARKARAAWGLLIPGFAAEFAQSVPASHLEERGSVVRCVCGARYELAPGELEECREPHADGMMRCFLRTESSVRVARWPLEADGDQAAAA